MNDSLPSVADVVKDKQPTEPLYCIRPATIIQTTSIFLKKFVGTVLYAVKCNPERSVLESVYKGGVTHFEVASLPEIRNLRQHFPHTVLHYMHPIKARSSIHLAYKEYGVRDFAFDDRKELHKILESTEHAKDLGLFLRIAVPSGGAVLDLSGRFGISPQEAVPLLRIARSYSVRLGVCFHVGSQCLEPAAFGRALETVEGCVRKAGVGIDVVDVGGGFPVSYPAMLPPSLDTFLETIHSYAKRFENSELWSEPGRALVATGGSLVVQVLARRGCNLFLNDGVFGGLADAGIPHYFRYPARLIPRHRKTSHKRLESFSFLGPTCDSNDVMPGPFMLPSDVTEGDWIELGQLGAYSASMRTQFHSFQGFQDIDHIHVSDPPLLTTPGYTNTKQVA